MHPTIDMNDDQALTALARRAALRYRRRCWWADVDEMVQEAWLVILRARRNYRPELAGARGFEGYVWRAIINWLRGYLWSVSKPVTVSAHVLQEEADLRALRDVVAESLDAIEHEPAPCRPIDEQVDDALWAAAAREAIDDAFQDLDATDRRLAEELLTRETLPAAAAAETGRKVAAVHRLRDAAWMRLASSPAVHAAWARRSG